MKDAVSRYCAQIGQDPLLVQGAGGNVSWKDGETLWVKASGTWLADAAKKDIFVSVDLPHLRAAMAARDFAPPPKVLDSQGLRPSIETVLHGLMPQKIVVHLHAVEVLARLVRKDFREDIAGRIPSDLHTVFVPYRKPGAPLAEAVSQALTGAPTAQVVFLENHGIVVGGERLEDVDRILKSVVRALTCDLHYPESPVHSPSEPLSSFYHREISDPVIRSLAFEEDLFRRLSADWALYPDHVVFLGASPLCFESSLAVPWEAADASDAPPMIFVKKIGVFGADAFDLGKELQLRCFADVLRRQRASDRLHSLSLPQIAELLNWDAERYRMGLKR